MLKHFKHARWLLLLFAASGLIISCQKENGKIDKTTDKPTLFPGTPEEKATVDKIKVVASILQVIYKDPKVREEVCATIASQFYTDEFVTLKDLLSPQTSSLYKSDKFTRQNVQAGIFERRFKEEFDKRFPGNASMRISGDYYTENGITIYWPYSEEFPPSFQQYEFTLVAADRDADEGPGQRPAGRNEYGEPVYETVNVNDDYAFINPTQIIGVVDKLPEESQIDSLPTPTNSVDRVFHGWSRLKDHLDRFISFTGNGGGSEMKIGRISGYLKVVNQQVTDFTGDLVTVNYKRRDVHRHLFKRVYSVWDPDWQPNNNEQTYAVYEEDNQGTKTFNGSLSTTLLYNAMDTTNTLAGSIGFSISVITQDEIITQRKISRNAYFLTAKQDQGWGFNMCNYGIASPCEDNTFLPSNQYWPIWDGGTTWIYLWPYKIY